MKNNQYFREFVKYSSLNVLGMLGLSCYILADTFFISKGFGTNGLTALNLAIPIYSFIHGSGLMLGMGGATKYAVFKGQDKHKEANTVFNNTIFLAILFSIVFVLVGVFLSKPLTTALRANADVFEMTNIYLEVILLFAPAFILNDILICFVRNDNSPKLSMLAMISGSLANILLDYIFIFRLHMGIFGAVFATGLAPLISLLILSSHWIRKKNGFCFEKMKISFKLSLSTLSLGFPSLITEASSGIVIIIFNAIILKLQGNTGVAAYGVIANLSLVVIAVFTGIAQGVQPIISRTYGYHDIKSIRAILRYALITMVGISICIYTSFFLFAEHIAQIFNSEADLLLQEIAVVGLRVYFISVFFVGFNIIISVFFTSTEKAFPAHMISLLRGFLLIIPMAFFLSALWGTTGVWLTFPITEGFVSILAVYLYFKLTKAKKMHCFN